MVPAWVYTAISVNKYFGFKGAAGCDHFQLQFREMPLVKRGIFRFSSNAMYAFGFLLFWTIAICFDSAGALIVAAFSHIYFWVNYHATEKPDMRVLYPGAASPTYSCAVHLGAQARIVA